MLVGVALPPAKRKGTAMTIYQLLEKTTFGPEEVLELSVAYEHTLRKLGLVERDDAVTELVASKMISLAQQGVLDRKQLIQLTMEKFGIETTLPG